MKVPEPDEERPLAWKAILADTPVCAADGEEVGAVGEVLGSETADIFHGIVVRAGPMGRDVVVPAEHVRSITNVRIETDMSAEELQNLPPYQQDESYKLGFVGLLGQRLGWVEDKNERV
jgi:uncharacterized protein YrrD